MGKKNEKKDSEPVFPSEIVGWEPDDRNWKGGQAIAWRVHSISNPGRLGVLKVLREDRRTDKSIARMKREIAVLKSCDHPSILRILDDGECGHGPYYVGEYCDGGDLSRHNLHQSGDYARVFEVFIGICQGVAEIHKKDIVHRDLHPANILFKKRDRQPKVADFGICYSNDPEQHLTETQETVGTRDYMAPELRVGYVEVVPPNADVYSLGKLLYFMLNGKVCPEEHHRHQNWNLAIKIGERFHIVNRFLDKMIAEKPENRFPSIKEVLVEAEKLKEDFASQQNVIHPDARKRCIYCGVGEYVCCHPLFDTIKLAKTNRQDRSVTRSNFLKYFGVIPESNNSFGANMDWLVMRCKNCGNVQVFWPHIEGDLNPDVEERWNPKK